LKWPTLSPFSRETNQPHKAEGQDPEAEPKPMAQAEAAPASQGALMTAPGCSTQPEAQDQQQRAVATRSFLEKKNRQVDKNEKFILSKTSN